MGIVRRRTRRRVLVAGGAVAVAHHMGKKSGQAEGEAPADDQETDYAPAPPENTGPDASDIEQIQKLAELHSSGALTDEEFAAAKAKLLA